MSSTEEGGGAVGAVSTDQTIIDNNDSTSIDMDDPLSDGEVAHLRSLDKPFYGGQPNFTAKPLIRKVPSTLRRNEDFRKYFTPKVISIGPLHHDYLTLPESKELKLKLAEHFVKKNGVDKESLYRNIKKEMDGLKECYDPQELENYSDDNKELAWMFFVDGCAIIQAVYMRYDGEKFMNAIQRFIDDTVINPGEDSGWWWKQQKGGERIHLLHLLREILVFRKGKPSWWALGFLIEHRFSKEARTKRHSFRNIKELTKAWIWLKASETSCLTDISFKHIFFVGKLRLPPISVDDSTMKLIAYEICPDFGNDFTVTSYMCFLDSLIDGAEDVKELSDAGILYNGLGSDKVVAKLFNKMNTDLIPNPMIYSAVKHQIDNHCKNMWINHAAQAYNTYFSIRWTFLAFVGAIASLFLSALQTYYTIHQRK